MEQITIPGFSLKSEVEENFVEYVKEIEGVLRSGQFIQGPNVALLEKELAQFLGVKHALTTNSGTDALVLSLRALGIGPGDEVITTDFSFFATAEAIALVGAQPVFCDALKSDFNIDVSQIEAKISPRTKAILPVHLFGQGPKNWNALLDLAKKKDLKVVEDVAQSFGSRFQEKYLGTFGSLGAYSFFPTKNLGAFGDGGLVVTSDDRLAEQVRWLREHGSPKKYQHELIGYTSRLDEMQAAILRIRHKSLPKKNLKRRKIAEWYRAGLSSVPGVILPEENRHNEHVYHQYTVRVLNGKRNALKEKLAEKGIGSTIYYPKTMSAQTPFRHLSSHCPIAAELCNEVLSLPMFPDLSEEQVQRVCQSIRESV